MHGFQSLFLGMRSVRELTHFPQKYTQQRVLSAEDVVRQGQDYSSLPGFHEMNLLRAGPV